MNPSAITSQIQQIGKRLKYSAPQVVETANRRKHYLKSVVLKSPPLQSFRFLKDIGFDTSPLFLDVGANYGQSAISMRHFVPGSRIRCVEANPSLAESLLYLSRKLGNMEVLMAAAGDQYSLLDLRIPVLSGVVNTGGASLSADFVAQRREILEDHYGGIMSLQSQRVPAIPLDALNSVPSFIKIDVEGQELSVLRGLKDTVREHRPVVMLETLHSDGKAADWLVSNGYQIHSLTPEGALGPALRQADDVSKIQDVVGRPV